MTEKIVLDIEEEIISSETELSEDVSDYVSSLFGISDSLINDSKSSTEIRLQELEKVKKEILRQFEGGKFQDEYKSLVITEAESLERKYLFNILSDLLALISEEEITKEKFLESILNEFGYLDSNDFYNGQDINFEKFALGNTTDINLKREYTIKNIFDGEFEKYLSAFKKKSLYVASILYKQLLFFESKKLTTKEVKNLIQHLKGFSGEGENKSLVSLMANGQKEFFEALKIVKSKDSFTDDDNDLLSFYLWLKKSPEESVKQIETLMKNTNKTVFFDEEKSNDFCLKVKESILKINSEIQEEEQKLIKSLIAQRKKAKRKILGKRIARVSAVVLFFLVLISGYNFFTDIERIYRNDFYKVAKVSMESVPYPSELKDSLNPGVNETRQKQRLDFIRDLNLRYFKVLNVFLSPDLKDSIPSLAIPDEIKSNKTIRIVRKKLSGIITEKEWNENYENLFGKNVLTQLRAYGGICNFLLPVLGHQVLKDTHGMPLIKNGQIQIHSAPSEKELLNKIEPMAYIEKYDTNYKNILRSCVTLLERIQKRKSELFKEYKNKKSKELTLTLKAVAILESRLSDLIEKIKQRHDYILKHNTYRAFLD